MEIGPAPFSIIAFHNDFFRQARRAFVSGAYYPALTATCALGERVLNHLLIRCRDCFRASAEYKHVYKKDSFDNWDIAIDTLESWKILRPSAASGFRNLRDIRHQSIHFNPEVEKNTRSAALSAIRLFHSIVEDQFGALGPKDWFVSNDAGITIIKKSFETDVFVSRVLVPCCEYVGPAHRLEVGRDGHFQVIDSTAYENTEVSDQEFIELYKKATRRPG
jgi:hypothetical protein